MQKILCASRLWFSIKDFKFNSKQSSISISTAPPVQFFRFFVIRDSSAHFFKFKVNWFQEPSFGLHVQVGLVEVNRSKYVKFIKKK